MATTKTKPVKKQVKKRNTTVKIYLPDETITYSTDRTADVDYEADSISYCDGCLCVTSRGQDHIFNGFKYWVTSWLQ